MINVLLVAILLLVLYVVCLKTFGEELFFQSEVFLNAMVVISGLTIIVVWCYFLITQWWATAGFGALGLATAIYYQTKPYWSKSKLKPEY